MSLTLSSTVVGLTRELLLMQIALSCYNLRLSD